MLAVPEIPSFGGLGMRGSRPAAAAGVRWASEERRRKTLETLHSMTRSTASLEQNYEKMLMYMLTRAGVHMDGIRSFH
jgi:hypothetical protein